MVSIRSDINLTLGIIQASVPTNHSLLTCSVVRSQSPELAELGTVRKVAVAKSKGGITEEFDPRISLIVERMIIRRDYELRSHLLRHDPAELKAGLRRVEGMMKTKIAVADLDKLCLANCDWDFLLWLLYPLSSKSVFPKVQSASQLVGSLEDIFGLTSRDFSRLLSSLDALGKQIECLNERAIFDSLFSGPWRHAGRLPRTLREYARLLQYAAQHFAGNAQGYDNVAKARLTSYVLACHPASGRSERQNWHDSEISSLISEVSGKEYDAVAHRMWRRKHYQRLKLLDPDLGTQRK